MIDKNSKDPDKDEFHMRFLFFLFSRNISSPRMFSTRRTLTQLKSDISRQYSFII